MNLNKRKVFKDLIKLYGHELAIHKQKHGAELHKNEEELYEILTYYHLSVQIREAINQYGEWMRHLEIEKVYSSINFLLFQISGDILKEVDKIDVKKANKILKNSIELLKNVRAEV
jgi:hypothetical protein